MPWSSTRGRVQRDIQIKSSGLARSGRTASLSKAIAPATIAALLFLAYTLGLSAAPSEKHLSVYSTAANYTLPLVQIDNHDYVGLLELLEPLGAVSAKTDGSRWRIRYNNVQGDFQNGKNRAKVQGRDAELTGKFHLQNDHGLIPVSSLPSLMPRFLGGPVTLHEASDRLFVGSIATHFTASLSSQNPPRLVFHFSSPVNPAISSSPGALRMTFTREPVVAPASPTLTFGNKTIPSANYSENNGAAVITVAASVPVSAAVSGDGRTVTVLPSSVAAQASSATPSTTAATPTQNNAPAQPLPEIGRRYFVVIDAAHGGNDPGETLGPSLSEKDITLALARSLRQEIESRGMSTLMLRDSDAALSLDQRAMMANASHAAIYVSLHAASSGHGVRVYTALLPFGGDDDGPFRAWSTAQRSSLTLSLTAALGVQTELQKRQIPNRDLVAPLRPLNNVVLPAIAVEVAPQGSDVQQLTAPDYQQLVTSAVATAIAGVRDQLGAAP